MIRHFPKGALRIRIPHGDLFAMGPGKADLLAAIHETHSISAAGRALGFSYWKTRQLLDEMNACFKAPVVETVKGGIQGGGACLTKLGQEALTRYQVMQERAESFLAEDMKAYRKLLKKLSK